jgi:hypothetical protein
MIVWGGMGASTLNTGAAYDPVTDTWTPMSTLSSPSARFHHTAVWTGTAMLVWGGRAAAAGSYNASGGRYDPASDTWSSLIETSAPSPRELHTAVWTGGGMIVWGGYASGSSPTGFHDSGGLYDPATQTWTPTKASGALRPAARHTAVWTGSEMLVWGGDSFYFNASSANGEAYDPGLDAWRPLATAGAPSARAAHTAVWTGSKMLVWGGSPAFFNQPGTGGAYDPVGDTWTAISLTGAPSDRYHHSVVWTGSRMIVWGGLGYQNTGGRYDPVADAWTPTSTVAAPSGRERHTAVWTGSRMIVWGGAGFVSAYLGDGGIYDPAADTWTSMSTAGAPSPRQAHTAVWTGSKMIVWGGIGGGGLNTDGAAYDPVTDTWAPISSTGPPSGRWEAAAVWTGTQMVLWGGCNGLVCFDTGGIYEPATDRWRKPPSLSGAPVARQQHTMVWTGSRAIVWGGLSLSTMGLFDPNAPPRKTTAVDVDGDGRSDILWRNVGGPDTGAMFVWMMGSAEISGATYLPAIASDWVVQGVGDLNGDGKADVLWRNMTPGQVDSASLYVWMMDGPYAGAGTGYTSTQADFDWAVAGIGDLDGDERSDIVWRAVGGPAQGALFLWSMDGTRLRSGAYLDPISTDWQIQDVADMDGDSKADILWRETSTGATYAWLMNGSTVHAQGYTASQADNRWQIQATGDFDGDGKSDILWRNVGGPDTGALFVWLMDGTGVKGATYLDPISTDWQVQGTADFNGDGKTDILWRNQNAAAGDAGFLYVWMMDGPTVIAGTGYTNSQADFAWDVKAPR